MGAPGADRPPRGPPREGERPPWFGDREGYRSSSGFGGEKGGVPGDYRPDFQSGGGCGFGRGGGGFNSRAPSATTEWGDAQSLQLGTVFLPPSQPTIPVKVTAH